MPETSNQSMYENGARVDPFRAAISDLAKATELWEANKVQQARRICERILGQHPDYVAALGLLSNIFLAMKQEKKALNALATALSVSPDNFRFLHRHGELCLQMGLISAAKSSLHQSLQLNAIYEPSLIASAKVCIGSQDYEQAVSILNSIESPNQIESIRDLLAECYIRMRDAEKAFPLLKASIETGQSSERAQIALAQIATFPFIEEEELSAHDLQSEGAEPHPEQALLAHKIGDFGEAWLTFERMDKAKGRGRDVGNPTDGRTSQSKLLSHRSTSRAAASSILIGGLPHAGGHSLGLLLQTVEGVKWGYDNSIIEDTQLRTLQMARCIPQKDIDGLPIELNSDFGRHYATSLEAQLEGSQVFAYRQYDLYEDVSRFSQLIPGARFVFLKRDADDLLLRYLLSGSNLAAQRLSNLSIRALAKKIQMIQDQYVAHIEDMPETCIIVNYEDMIEDPASVLKTVCDFCDLEVPLGDLPLLGDDRGVADPYKEFIKGALSPAD